jgi:hypothetical protein
MRGHWARGGVSLWRSVSLWRTPVEAYLFVGFGRSRKLENRYPFLCLFPLRTGSSVRPNEVHLCWFPAHVPAPARAGGCGVLGPGSAANSSELRNAGARKSSLAALFRIGSSAIPELRHGTVLCPCPICNSWLLRSLGDRCRSARRIINRRTLAAPSRLFRTTVPPSESLT